MEMLFADKQKDTQNKQNQFSPSLIDFRITIIDHHKIIKKSVQQIHLLIKQYLIIVKIADQMMDFVNLLYLHIPKYSLSSLHSKGCFGGWLLTRVEILRYGEGFCLGGEGKLPIGIITGHHGQYHFIACVTDDG